MPKYGKKSFRGVPYARSKKTFRKSGSKRPTITYARKGRTISLNTHRFSRYCAATTELVDSVELDKGYNFQFNDLLGSGEFASLFDRYRLEKVVMTFQLVNNPNAGYYPNVIGTVNTNAVTSYVNSTNFYPKMWYIADHDDDTAEAIVTMKERVGVKCRILQPNKTIKIVVKPAVAAMVYQTAIATGYGPKWNQWIDMTHSTVPHYGLKVAFDTNALDPTDTAPFRVRVEKKYYFTCKDVR